MRFVVFTFPDPEYAATWLEIDAAEREAEIELHREWFDGIVKGWPGGRSSPGRSAPAPFETG
ncbi:MAG: hypothetical protein M3R49_08100 [Chloroflexota bacterium]|nr:hypothetical protein [Chloroflexota bacterium]